MPYSCSILASEHTQIVSANSALLAVMDENEAALKAG